MFGSFFLAGFECATGINRSGQWFDQICDTRHDVRLEEDYALVDEYGMKGIREGVRWPLIDRSGHYDFSSLEPFVMAAQEAGLSVIWDLFHFGYPHGLDLFSLEFPDRFEQYCYAVGQYLEERVDGPLYFTPINEASYFSYAAGEAGFFAPHCVGRGWELKVCLARAAIHGINALRAAAPGSRMVSVDPLCYVVQPYGQPELEPKVREFNEHTVFQTWDMLSGRLLPELGGTREHLDIIGVNYYWTNQWEYGRSDVYLAEDDPRRKSLKDLLLSVWARYGGDFIISETSHGGPMRATWLDRVHQECRDLLVADVPIRGVCLYPIISMPEWHERSVWTPLGLWDVDHASGSYDRIPHEPALEVLRRAQGIVGVSSPRENLVPPQYHGTIDA